MVNYRKIIDFELSATYQKNVLLQLQSRASESVFST